MAVMNPNMRKPKVPQTGGPSIGVNNPNASTNPASYSLEQLKQQRVRTLDEIKKRGGRANASGYANRLVGIENQIRGLRTPRPPTTNAPEGTINQPAPEGAPPVQGEPVATNPASDEATSALFPSLKYQLPENYQGSPMYKWQMAEGNKMLDRRLSRSGLLGSGAEVEGANRLAAQVGAQESDRLRDDMQTEADRYERLATNEAARQTDMGNTQWNRLIDVYDRQTRQSPMERAFAGLESMSELMMNRGKGASSNTANNFTRVSAPRQSVGAFAPPAPSGPNYSNANILAAVLGDSRGRNTGSFIDSILGSGSQILNLFR